MNGLSALWASLNTLYTVAHLIFMAQDACDCYCFVKTFQWRHLLSVLFTWTMSSLFIAVLSPVEITIDRRFGRALLADHFGVSDYEVFAAMAASEQLRHVLLYGLSNTSYSSSETNLANLSWGDSMSLRHADKVFTPYSCVFRAFRRLLVDISSVQLVSGYLGRYMPKRQLAGASERLSDYTYGLALLYLLEKFIEDPVAAAHLLTDRHRLWHAIQWFMAVWDNNTDFRKKRDVMMSAAWSWLFTENLVKRASNYIRQKRVRRALGIARQARTVSGCARSGDADAMVIKSSEQVCLLCQDDLGVDSTVPDCGCQHTLHAGCWLLLLSQGNGRCPMPGCKAKPDLVKILKQASQSDIEAALV